MDEHMEELLEKAPSFLDGELCFHPDYDNYNTAANMLEDMMIECFGGEVAQLMREYMLVRFEVVRFYCLHYFREGYLAAKREKKAQKRPDAKASGLFPVCLTYRAPPA